MMIPPLGYRLANRFSDENAVKSRYDDEGSFRGAAAGVAVSQGRELLIVTISRHPECIPWL
jgi:hypothetical protein